MGGAPMPRNSLMPPSHGCASSRLSADLPVRRRRAVGGGFGRLRPDLVMAVEHRTGADSDGRCAYVALHFGLGADQDGAEAFNRALHLAADDQPAALDRVG